MSNIIYSFDIFDTVLTRKVSEPKDIFYIVEKKLEKFDFYERNNSFYNVRVEAEKKVRLSSNKEDITINEIYETIGKQLKWNEKEIEKAMNTEIQVELENCIPIVRVCEYIKTLKRNNNKVIFVSDMYLTKPYIQKLLRQIDLDILDEDIFVSSEIGLTKRTGNLFKYVVKELSIKNKQLNHTGDNYRSDVIVPRILGINTYHRLDGTLNRYEKIKLLNSKYGKDIAAISRSVRVSKYYENEQHQAIWDIAATVGGPLVTEYTKWLLKKAIEKNIDVLYFVARDGQIVYDIAKEFCKQHKIPIECKYLYGSRKAWYIPAIITQNDIDYVISKEGWLFRGVEQYSYKSIYERIGLEKDDITVFIEKIGIKEEEFSKKNNPDKNLVLELFKFNEVRNLILKKSSEQRKLVTKYFKQEGLLENKQIGLVDLGWTGEALSAAKNIIQSDTNIIDNIYGFFIGKRNIIKEGNNWIESWLFDDKNKCTKSQVCLLETLFAANHGTTIGYKEDRGEIIPIIKEEDRQKLIDWGLEVQQEAIKFYAYQYSNNIDYNHRYSRDVIKNIFNTMVFYPENIDVIAYGNYPFSTEIGDSKFSFLAAKVNLKELIKNTQTVFIFNKLLFKKQNEVVLNWREGSAKQIGKIASKIVSIDQNIVKAFYRFK